MYRDECRAADLGLVDSRDVIVWRCAHAGCGRYFLGTLGYQSYPPVAVAAEPTRRCARDGAFLVAQRSLRSYVCPVAGCATQLVMRAANRFVEEAPLAASH
jgi:hypothetical protein